MTHGVEGYMIRVKDEARLIVTHVIIAERCF